MATIPEALQIAVQQHQTGKLDAAERIYRQILAVQANHPDVLHLLGTLHLQRGDLITAVELLRQAIAASPHVALFHVRLGVALAAQGHNDAAIAAYEQALSLQGDFVDAEIHLASLFMQRGQLGRAVTLYRQILDQHPDMAAVHNDLGNALQGLGQFEAATVAYRRTLELLPDTPAAYSNLGNAEFRAGHLDAALRAYQRAIELQPDFSDAHYNLANLLREQGHSDEAITYYRRAIELNPAATAAASNLGQLLQSQGEFAEAERLFRRVIEQQPNSSDAWNNLGSWFKAHRRLNEASEAFRRALTIDPHYVAALNNLAAIAQDEGRVFEAIELYRRAVAIEPGLAGTNINLSSIWKSLGQLDEAEACSRRALATDPRSAKAYESLGNVLMYQGRIEAALAAYEQSVQLDPKNSEAHSNYLLALQYNPDVSLERLHAAHRAWDVRHAAPLRRTGKWPAIVANPDRPLRIGIVSADLAHHPIGFLVGHLIEQRDRDDWQLVAYSNRLSHDHITARIRTGCDLWRDVATLSDRDLAHQIESDRIDILLDLSGHTYGNRLLTFARQPAPIQASWLGYVGSTGLAAIEYLIVDDALVPDELVSCYHEEVIRLPKVSCCYELPVAAPEIGPLPALARGQVTFASFNNLAKVTPAVVAVWARILNRVPHARLLIKFLGCDCPSVQQHYRAQFRAQGVDLSRIEFQGSSPFHEMLDLYNTTVDIGLDPFPYTGGTTTILASYMGVPVITWPGETVASRQSYAVLNALGIHETIAYNLDDYIECAINLANDLPRLAELRQQLRIRYLASPIADAKRLATNLTREFRRIWRAWATRHR